MPTPTKLGLRVKLGYGVCDLGGNLFFTVTAFVLLNYLTDTVGLIAGLAGTALMIGRIWDAFYDPIIGYASDRTRSRWGRRRPFMFIGSIPLFLRDPDVHQPRPRRGPGLAARRQPGPVGLGRCSSTSSSAPPTRP